MRRPLQLALVVTLVLSAAALWPRGSSLAVVAARVANAAAPDTSAPPTKPGDSLITPPTISAAIGDPFALPATNPPPPLAAAPATANYVASPPQATAAPAPAHRFFGRFRTPAGEDVLLLARGPVPVAIAPGMTLDDGYVVQDVLPEAVRLSHPPTGAVFDLPLPPPLSAASP